MHILTLMLAVLVSCCKADIPAVDKASASPVVSAADCRENQIKGYQTADLNKILSRTRFVLDMKHTSQVQLFRLSITTAATMPLALFVGGILSGVYMAFQAGVQTAADSRRQGRIRRLHHHNGGLDNPGNFEAVAFDYSGTGYAATKENNLKTYTFLKSLDNGRTWSQVTTLKGSCSEIVPHNEEIYFVSCSREIWKFRTNEDFVPERVAGFGKGRSIYKLKVFDDSTFVCGMNAIYRDLDSMTVLDSLMVSKDAGKT